MSKDKRKSHARQMQLLRDIGLGAFISGKRPYWDRWSRRMYPHIHFSNPDLRKLIAKGLVVVRRRTVRSSFGVDIRRTYIEPRAREAQKEEV